MNVGISYQSFYHGTHGGNFFPRIHRRAAHFCIKKKELAEAYKSLQRTVVWNTPAKTHKQFNISYSESMFNSRTNNYYFGIYSLHEKERLNNKDLGYCCSCSSICLIQRNRDDPCG